MRSLEAHFLFLETTTVILSVVERSHQRFLYFGRNDKRIIMTNQDKVETVKALTKDIKDSSAVVLVDYAGLDVKSQQELKRELKKVDARMLVVKNTLFKIAGKEAGSPEEALTDTVLSGPTAMILTKKDPIAPLQVLDKFMKENELPQFKVGIVENAFQDKDALIKLSKLPGKEVLAAQAVGAVAAPLYGLVGTLQGPMQKLVFILKQASQKES